MTTYQNDERSSYAGYSAYPRPSTAQGGNDPSPDRLHSSKGYAKGANPPPLSPYQTHQQAPAGSSHGYPPQPPITPLSSSTYPPQPPPSGTTYYGLATPTTDHQHVPSPPPSSSGRPDSSNFTTEGVPIVPVGISGGKMFRCRGYGDCDKVFTRSEHLARHVRKHTGERPFPCHCGKAFSRLDNLRQHSATVHADQAALNDAMLTSLAPVHAALSQRANRDQRKRGEVVEVPKNAVERPRHSEQYRNKSVAPGGPPESPYPPYPPQEHQFTVPQPPQSRPRTGGGYDYPYPDQPPAADESGPSRRPGSSYSPYQAVYYDQGTRPPTAAGPAPDMAQLPYPYRPMSSNGRELPVPAHYQDSEPPSSAHGPPQSPMYPPAPNAPPQWSSPPTAHTAYPPQAQPQPYPPPPQDGYSYPPQPEQPHYGPPPGSAHGGYHYPPPPGPPTGPGPYYPPHPQGYGSVAPPAQSYPPPPPAYGPPPAGLPPHPSAAGPSESPFQYHAPAPPGAPHAPEAYPYGHYDSRKRRADEGPEDAARKMPRPSLEGPPPESSSRTQEPLWLPSTTERRSSLAISALLGSPQQVPRSRPSTADVPPLLPGQYGQPPGVGTYGYHEAANHGAPPTPALEHPDSRGKGIKLESGIGRVGENMEQKAKALLSQGR